MLSEKGAAQVQKITTTPHILCLQVRVKGESLYIYLGRGAEYFGFWTLDTYVPAKYRIHKDKTVESFKKELKGRSITGVCADENIPLLTIDFYEKGKKKTLFWGLGSEGVGFALKTEGNKKVFTSWAGKVNVENPRELFNEYTEKSLWGKGGEIENYFASLEQRGRKGSIRKKVLKKTKSKIGKIETDVERLQTVDNYKKDLVENKLELGAVFNHEGLKVKFKKDLTQFQKRDKLFGKLKDWERAYQIQKVRLSDSKEKLSEIKSEIDDFDISSFKVIPINWGKGKKHKNNLEKNKKPSGDYELFELASGVKIGIGKSATGNDELRKYWGKKDDYWFHIEGETGSHLILKGDLVPELFPIIASVLRDYSGSKGFEISVIYATVGKVRGVSGRKGAVTISKPRYFQSDYDPNWREIISKDVSRASNR